MSYLKVISNRNDWKQSLEELGHYDFYHTYDYHQFSKSKNEKAILLIYTEENITICFPFLIRKIKNTDFFDATSVYGYAGPIQKSVNANFNNKYLIEKLNQYFIKENIISVFSRLNPFIKNQNRILSGIGEVQKLGNIVNIDLTKSIEDQRLSFSKTTKRYLNKTRKLLDFKISRNPEDIEEFIDLYYENMDRVKANEKYYFTKDYFYKFLDAKDFKTDFLFAIDKESKTIISAAMMVKTNDIIQYHLSGTKNNFLNLSPIRLIIDEMRIRGTKDQFSYFNLGGGLGNEEDELFRFKSSFSKDHKPFFVWKYIVNNKVYDLLVKKNTTLESNLGFFPLYRNE